jgi:outer membrane biosynthesis protein TonB
MRRIHRIVFLMTLAAALPALSGCADFDADKLDIFGLNEKKKLPGERKAIFPEGVPGVTQGIPPEYIRGNQPAPETAVAVPAEPEKPAAKPKPAKKTATFTQDEKPKRKPKPRPASAEQQQAPAGQQQPAPWPEQQAPAQSSSSGSAPWPSAPAPGTFSR